MIGCDLEPEAIIDESVSACIDAVRRSYSFTVGTISFVNIVVTDFLNTIVVVSVADFVDLVFVLKGFNHINLYNT